MPLLFSERRGLIIKDLQDLPEDSKAEVTRYLDQPDPTMTVVFVHKGGVKGKALLDAIKKVKPEIVPCDAIKKESEKEDFVKGLFQDAGRKATPKKYSDETLARVANISTAVLCECPRHVAELLTQLSSFEQYSQECVNKNSVDQQLHEHLAEVSGQARALFEHALELIAAHEGIAL